MPATKVARGPSEVGPALNYTPTDECPMYYNGGDMFACASRADLWWTRHFAAASQASGNNTVFTLVGFALEESVAVLDAASHACDTGVVMPVALEAYRDAQGVPLPEMNMSLRPKFLGSETSPICVTVANAYHGPLLSGDRVIVSRFAPALTTLVVPQAAPHPHGEGTVQAFVDTLARCVPGLPLLTAWSQHKRVAWRRLLLWCHQPVVQLLAFIHPLVRLSHSATHSINKAVEAKAVRALVGARAEISIALLTPLMRWMRSLQIIVMGFTEVSHAEYQSAEFGLQLISSPYFVGSMIAILQAPPVAVSEALASLLTDDVRCREVSGEGDLFDFAATVLVPLTQALSRIVERSVTQLPFLFGFATSATGPPLGNLVMEAISAMHYMLTRLTALQRLPAHDAWPGHGRDIIVGALLRGLNVTLRVVVPWVEVLQSRTIEHALPTKEEVRNTTNFSQRHWSSLVASSYAQRHVGGSTIATSRQQDVDLANLILSKDRLTAFATIVHALRILDRAAELAMSDPTAVSALPDGELVAALNHSDMRGTFVYCVTAVNQRFDRCEEVTEDMDACCSGWNPLSWVSLRTEHTPATQHVASTPPPGLRLVDCVAAIHVILPGTPTIVIWCRAASLGTDGIAHVQIIQDTDAGTLHSLITAVEALGGRALLLVAAPVVSSTRRSTEDSSGSIHDVHGGAFGKLSAVYRSLVDAHVLQHPLRAVESVPAKWARRPAPSSALEALAHPSFASPQAGERQRAIPDAVLRAALARRPPAPLSAAQDAQTFRIAAQQHAPAVHLTPAQEEAVSSAITSTISRSAHFSVASSSGSGGGGVHIMGLSCTFISGGPGTGKSTVLRTIAAATVVGLQAVRHGPPLQDAVSHLKTCTAAAPSRGCTNQQLCDASIGMKRVQRALASPFLIHGAQAQPLTGPSIPGGFSLYGALSKTAASCARAPITTTVLAPRLCALQQGIQRCIACLASPMLESSRAAIIAFTAAALPERHLADFISSFAGTDAAAKSSFDRLEEALDASGFITALRKELGALVGGGDDGALCGEALDAGDDKVPVAFTSLLPSSVQEFARDREANGAASYVALAARCVLGVAHRSLKMLSGLLSSCFREFASVIASVAVAQLLGGTLYTGVAHATPSDLSRPGASLVLAQWHPPVVLFDDADLAPDTSWRSTLFASTSSDRERLSDTALGSRMLKEIGHSIALIATFSSECPTMLSSIWHPANAAHLCTTPSHGPGAMSHRPWCSLLLAVAARIGDRAAVVVHHSLPTSPGSNRITQSADIAQVACTLRMVGGRLDADDEGTLSLEQAPGLGGSVFVVTFNDVAASRKAVAPSSILSALDETTDAIFSLCRDAFRAIKPSSRVAVADVLPNGEMHRARVFERVRCPSAGGGDSWLTRRADWQNADDESFDALVINIAPGSPSEGGGVDIYAARAQGSDLLQHPSAVVPCGDEWEGDPRFLSRLVARTKSAVVCVAPLTVLAEWLPLRYFAEVGRRLLSLRGEDWLFAACRPQTVASTATAELSAHLHVPVLPLRCPLHPSSKSALLVTVEPGHIDGVSLCSLGASLKLDVPPMSRSGFVALLGTSGTGGTCRSLCFMPFHCGHPSHRCLRSCHWAEALIADDAGGGHRECSFACETILSCGHRCTGRCGEVCPPCPRSVVLGRGCGTTLISGFKDGHITLETHEHFIRRVCGSSGVASDDPPCDASVLVPCVQCTSPIDVACYDSHRAHLCDGCCAAAAQCMAESGNPSYNFIKEWSDELAKHAEAQGEISSTERSKDALMLVIQQWPSSVREAMSLHWARTRAKVQLDEKRRALMAAKHGPEAVDERYRLEAERVRKMKAERDALVQQTALLEKAIVEEVKVSLRAALRSQVEVNAESELLMRAISDLTRRECTSCAST